MTTENANDRRHRHVLCAEAFRRGLCDDQGSSRRRAMETRNALHALRTTSASSALACSPWQRGELLYPLLCERAAEHQELFSRMDAQHVAVTSSLEAAQHAAKRFGETGSAADGRALAEACESLLETLDVHLSQEEDEVLPIAARVVSPAEWGALPAHALRSIPAREWAAIWACDRGDARRPARGDERRAASAGFRDVVRRRLRRLPRRDGGDPRERRPDAAHAMTQVELRRSSPRPTQNPPGQYQ